MNSQNSRLGSTGKASWARPKWITWRVSSSQRKARFRNWLRSMPKLRSRPFAHGTHSTLRITARLIYRRLSPQLLYDAREDALPSKGATGAMETGHYYDSGW